MLSLQHRVLVIKSVELHQVLLDKGSVCLTITTNVPRGWVPSELFCHLKEDLCPEQYSSSWDFQSQPTHSYNLYPLHPQKKITFHLNFPIQIYELRKQYRKAPCLHATAIGQWSVEWGGTVPVVFSLFTNGQNF